MKILADASLPELERAFPPPFSITCYHDLAELQANLTSHSILLCRSTLKVNQELLGAHHLDWVLTASSGRDHLDETYLNQVKTNILDAKGSNANAVVDYIRSTLTHLYTNYTFKPRSIGIIGVGEVGSLLLAYFNSQGFKVYAYDPLRAQNDTNFLSATLEQISSCNLICLHPNLHYHPPFPSFHLIDRSFLEKLAPSTIIINAARGQIVEESAMLSCYKGKYCTDVYANEPTISKKIIQFATLCTPHIAGHTVEAKIEAVRTLSRQLHSHIGLASPIFPDYPPITQHKIYDPGYETQQLKQTQDLTDTFLTLRKEHIRHEGRFFAKNAHELSEP